MLFVQGLAGAWFEWDPVVPLLAGDHRLVRFDRSGPGLVAAGDRRRRQTSAAVPGRRGRAAGPGARRGRRRGPGEGLRGRRTPTAPSTPKRFARLHPERIAGIVFVDASAEPDVTPAPGGPGHAGSGGAFVRGTRLLGLNQVLGPAVRRLVYQTASTTHRDPDRELGRAVYRSSRVAAAVVNELWSYRPSAVELLELRCERPFPRCLVQVLVGAAGAAEDGHARRWVERQREFAGLFPGAEVVELPDAKHLIAADRPDAVATAVRSLGF